MAILAHNLVEDSLGNWEMGTADVVLNAGHGEYMPDEGRPKVAFAIHTSKDYPEGADDGPLLPYDQKLAHTVGADDEGWGLVLRMTGPVVEIARAFYEVAAKLDPRYDPTNYTPGGDDDTFDYWPSGMDMLYWWALDMDQLTEGTEAKYRGPYNPTGKRYLERYEEIERAAEEREVMEYEYRTGPNATVGLGKG